MRPTRALLSLSLLVSTAALATTNSDLRVSLGPSPASARPGDTIAWTAGVENRGPDEAHDVHLLSMLDDQVCVDERIPTLAAGATRTVECRGTAVVRFSGYYSILSVDTDTVAPGGQTNVDPDPLNDSFHRIIELITPPDLFISPYSDARVDPGLPFGLSITYGNTARTAATGVVITVDVPANVGIGKLPDLCTGSGQRIECAVGTIAPRPDPQTPDAKVLLLTLVAPETPETEFTVDTRIRANEPDVTPQTNEAARIITTSRRLAVTTDADSGEGSLRAAIEAANAICSEESPCRISFELPANGSAWRTIKPRSPLPALTASGVTIDGTMQTRLIGDTNPNGPEIELDGSEVGSAGNGLDIAAPCSGSVMGLAINGFPDAGLYLHGPACETFGNARVIGLNYIGTDPTGTTALPNGRGIVVDLPARWPYTISQNVISGNRRSGIYVAAGATAIRENSIGLGADRRPLGNGASGVYVAPAGRGTDLFNNYVGFNHDSGLSVARDADWVSAFANSFQGNWQLAIDYALDGVSQSAPFRSDLPAGEMHLPEITSARYDPVTNRTIIEGTGTFEQANPFFGSFFVQLYANDAPDDSGYGEGQYVLGSAPVAASGRFTFSYPGRVPGPWVAATMTNTSIWGFATSPRTNVGGGGYSTTTTEFSRTVKVSE